MLGLKLRLLAGVVVVATALALIAAAPSAGTPSSSPRFHAPVVIPGSSGGSEPFVALANGVIRYVTWQSPGQFATSTDGIHYTKVATPDESADGDTSDAVDASGAVYDAQICGGATSLHTCLWRSTDRGAHWTLQNNFADNHPGASDRPWIDVYPKHTSGTWNPDKTTVYLEYHTFSPEDLAYVTVSHDGGKTFSTPVFITSDPAAINSSFCNTVPGGVVVNQNSPKTVYALWLSGNDSQSNTSTGCNYSQIGPFDKAWVSASYDGGTTWTSHLAWQGAFDPTTKIGDNANKIFGTIALDGGGQVHVVVPVRKHDDTTTFAATGQESPEPTVLLLATSPDRGVHWTKPTVVSKTNGSYFFPWITAGGGTGRLDAVFYRSSTLKPNAASSLWYLAFSQITNARATLSHGAAVYAAPPNVVELVVDPQPAHKGGICTFGLFCSAVNGNRNLADSISIATDREGQANLVWTNDYPNGTSRILFACQNGGPTVIAGVSRQECTDPDDPTP